MAISANYTSPAGLTTAVTSGKGATPMMIYNDSTTGVNISVNMPRVTPEMIALAEKAPGKRLVIEIAPTLSQDDESLEDATRALMEHLENYCDFPSGDGEKRLSNRIYAALGDTFTCQGCDREESQCSADPCEAVIADRAA